jgi:hypothetical protein
MKTKMVRLHGPDDTTIAMLDELRTNLLRLFETVKKPVYLIQLTRGVIDGGFARNLECLTTGPALNRRIVLKPSQRLLELMSAMRTWDRESQFVG